MLPTRHFLRAFIHFGTYIPYEISLLEKTDNSENSNIAIFCVQTEDQHRMQRHQMLCSEQEIRSQMNMTVLTSPTSS